MGERTARLLIGALVALAALPAPPTAAQEAGVAVDGAACPDPTGVTVVIDFRELGDDTVLVRCAPEAPEDGFAALEQAGIPYRTAVAFPGFLCRIADRPDDDPCATASPDDAYWSYWLAPAGGDWCYSNKGAGNRTPPAGAVEGWSFALDRTAEDVLPPRHDPPGSADGAAPLAPDDCTTATVSGGDEPDDGTPTTVADREEAIGRGDAVDPTRSDDAGSPVGTIAGVVAIAAVVAVAVLVARRRRRPATDETEPTASAADAEPLDERALWGRPPDDER